jgi:hypothetical protein
MLSSGGSGGIGALGLMYPRAHRIGTAFELANRWREQRLLLQHLLTCSIHTHGAHGAPYAVLPKIEGPKR